MKNYTFNCCIHSVLTIACHLQLTLQARFNNLSSEFTERELKKKKQKNNTILYRMLKVVKSQVQ